MRLSRPDIPEHERTPLVLLLLDIIHQQHPRSAPLEDEIAPLKGRQPRPTIQPSTRGAPPPPVDRVQQEMASHEEDLLRVLERPEVPWHNNTSERHIREYVARREVSGGTRSDAGRRARDTLASLKKTCRCLGVNFWGYVPDRVLGRGVIVRLAEWRRRRAAGAGGEGVAAVPA